MALLRKSSSFLKVAERSASPVLRNFSTVVKVKDGEVGEVSGIPTEHLRRKVNGY